MNVPQGTISAIPSNANDYTKITTDYIGNMIYENGALKEILLPEGYWQDGMYYYYLKDHLGNNRVVINGNGAIIEKSHYYPSGMRFQESTSNSAALPYRYGGKELEAMNWLNQYDFEARRKFTWAPITTTPDPLCEKYYSISPYSWCANNPVRYTDPDGRDGMVTGTGTQKDPYIITANYYYQNGSLNDEQLKGLNTAINDYNKSGGKNGVEVKNADGSTSFVKYNLSAQGVDDVDAARLTTKFEDTSGDTHYYGNVVGTQPDKNGAGDELGSANAYRVDFNVPNINAGIEGGMNSNSLNKGVAIHEIGHNLGGEHSDGTSVMDKVNTTKTFSQIGGTTTVTYSYPSTSNKFTVIIFNERDTPRIDGNGRLWTKKP